ncbi:MAG: cytochrome c [Gammaproteobacteria bacterium]|nr:cytochrome c [Gammaproteobacteria bacterium]
MIKLRYLAAAVVATGAIQAAPAADLAAGKALAQKTCAACHGVDGIGIVDLYPNLAGQKASYLAAQLKAFRAGSRNNPIMSPMAKSLSDAEIENVAAYYAGLSQR